jgi:hypothetical protein
MPTASAKSGKHEAMAFFRFRTRSPERDRDTDVGRLQRLRQSLADIRAEMEREKNGLRDRYEKVMANAAFSQQLVEDERGGSGMSSTVDDMTGTMIRNTKRLAALQAQVDFRHRNRQPGRCVRARAHRKQSGC